MLPSWRDRLILAIYPDRICWLRVGRGMVASVAAHGTVSCAAEPDSPWQNAIKLLPEVLKSANAAGTSVTVVLSNRLVRYVVTSNPDAARNQEELDLLTRHAFERVHGEASKTWMIRLSEAAPGKQALASAIDQRLVDALHGAIVAAGAKIVSLQPYLMAAFNHFKRTLPRRDGVLVLAEPQRLCHLAWKDGGWCAVQQMNSGEDWAGALPGMLDRLAMTAGLQDMQILQLCAPELPDAAMVDRPWQVKHHRPTWLKGLSPHQDKAYAGALLALSWTP